MTVEEIMQEIQQFSINDKLWLVEQIARSLRNDLSSINQKSLNVENGREFSDNKFVVKE